MMEQYNKIELEVIKDDEKFFGMKIKLNPEGSSYFNYIVAKSQYDDHISEVVNVIGTYIKGNFKNLYKKDCTESVEETSTNDSDSSIEKGENKIDEQQAS
jgi:hypothetical protein